jgi:hypothetical protein
VDAPWGIALWDAACRCRSRRQPDVGRAPHRSVERVGNGIALRTAMCRDRCDRLMYAAQGRAPGKQGRDP